MPFSSLRSRLLLLVVLALIPAFGLFVFSASDNRQHESITVQRNALYSARLIAGEQQQLILGTRQLLTALAHLRQVNDRDASACSQLFAELLQQYPLYVNLGATDAWGDVFCSAVPFTPPLNLADRLWFQRAATDHGFVVGEYQVGRITGKPSIIFAYPLLDPTNSVLAVVFAAVDLERLNQTSLQNRLPANAVMNLIDHNGTVLLRIPGPVGLIGKTMPESDIVQAVLTQGEGTGEMNGMDGIARLYAFSPVGGTDQKNQLYVAIGTPVQDAFADADWILRRNLIAMGLASVLVLAGAWVLGHWFIMRRVQALVRTTQRVESGDLSARTGLAYGFSELSQLARAFDRMAGSLELRDFEQQRMKEALRRQALVFENATDGIVITDLERHILDWNPGAEKIFGYHKAQVVGQSAELLQPQKDRARTGVEIAEGVKRAGRWSGELPFVRRDGSEGIAETHIVPLRDEQGKVIAQVGINRDITERKRTEHALRDKAEALQTLARVNREMLATAHTAAILELVSCRAAELLHTPKALLAIAAGDAPPLVGTFGIKEMDPATAEEGRKWGAEFWGRRQPGPHTAFGFVVESDEKEAGPAFLNRESVNALALAPLKVGEQWLGILMVLDTWPRSWNEDEIQLLDLLANQTALALDKARLFEETQRRAEQLGLLYDAGLVLNSVREPHAQLEFLFKITQKTLHADRVEFFRFHPAGEELAFEFGVGYAAEIVESLSHLRFSVREAHGLVARAAREHLPLSLPDLRADPDYTIVDPSLQSGMWMPVEHEQRLLGVLGILSERSSAFTPSDERLLVLFANQAAIALENARLFEELRKSLAMTTRFYELSNQILSATTLPETARVVLRTLREGFAADSASLHLFASPGHDEFRLGDGFPPSFYRSYEHKPEGFTDQALNSGKPFLVDDPAQMSPQARAQGIQTTVILPLRVDARQLGAVFLDYVQPRRLADRELELFALFANQVALALERVRLVDETQRQIVELAAVNRISSTLRAAQTIDEIASPLLDEILALLQVTSGCIYIYDAANDQLVSRAAREWTMSTIDKPREGITGQAFANGHPYVSHEFKSDPNLLAEARAHVGEGWGGAHIPISAGQTIVGVLAVAVPLPREITPAETHLLTTIAEIAGSAIHRAQLHAQTEQRLRRLTALREIDQAISASLDLRIALNVLLGQTSSQLEARAVSILQYDPATQTLEFNVGRGFRGPPSRRIRLSEGAAGRAFLERQTVRSNEWRLTGDEPFDFEPLPPGARRLYYATPLIAKGQVAGILEVFYLGNVEPDAEWLEFLNALAGQAAIAIENAQLFSNLQRSNAELALAYDTTLEGWSRALDLRDREGEGHTLRVTEMALRLAEALGVNHSELGHLRRGALLHDIGKMGLPDAVLLKPGPLTDEEWAIMRQHPVHAYELLSPIAYLRSAVDIPHYHHEKWDGTGYPRGLKGEQIPLSARIFAVVDVYDALQCERPYRPAWSASEAQVYVQEQAGQHFDPQVVPVFMRMVKDSSILG